MVALLSLKPWEPEESIPRLEPSGIEVGVADSVALPTVAPAVAVVEAAVAPGRAKLVGRTQEPAREGDGRGGSLAVGPARAVAVGAGEAVPAPSPAPIPASPAPEAPVATTPAPELAAVPTPPNPAPEAKAPGGPVSAGGPGPEAGEEECAGDEYVLTITLLDASGEAMTILLEHVAADGSVETEEFEGDLEDAQSLVLQLSAEGGCVAVEVVPPAGDEEAIPSP